MEQDAGADMPSRDRTELGDGLTVLGHGQVLAGRDAVEDLAATVTEVADRNVAH